MKYNFKNINIAQIKTFKGYDFDQIIVENRSILKDEKFLKIFNRNIIFRKKSTFTCLEWSEKYLQRFLPELLDKDLLINDLYNFDDKFFSMRIKRVGDILLSIILLVTTLPILLLSILIIFIQDKGPILYSQTRIGRDGKEFRIYKLRSMVINSETMGAQWSKSNDKRITKFGKIIRIFRIDELPQLGSVIAGDMSLIGPRPERPEIIKTLEKEIPFYNFRNALRPGISGWAQVNYPYGASIKDSKNKLSFDLYYLNNFNILLDFLIFFKTIKVVFRAIGAIPK